MRLSRNVLLVALMTLGACSEPTPRPNAAAQNQRRPLDVVQAHLRAVERGAWSEADALLNDGYRMRMRGMPFFVRINRAGALDMHRARKQAFPDFRFNEVVEWERDNQVRIAVYLTGTHTGVLEYPSSVGVPRTEPTGRTIRLPAEYFVYTVEQDKIVHTYGEIPEGHGPAALMQQLGIASE